MLEERIEQDIKTALLARDSHKATTLRGLKATLLNVKVAKGKRESGLSDDEVIDVLAKEAKKRQESADLYKQGGNEVKAADELAEKAMIEVYLPEQLSQDEIIKLIESKTGAAGDGALIARLVKEKLQ
jgi:uncharacterized protein YqeY